MGFRVRVGLGCRKSGSGFSALIRLCSLHAIRISDAAYSKVYLDLTGFESYLFLSPRPQTANSGFGVCKPSSLITERYGPVWPRV